jgi:branched-chain amino acid transport system ATP-binding protein
MTLLSVEDLHVAYGDLLAVRGVSFAVQENDVFVLLGSNGAGKTTILRCISGMITPTQGRVSAAGASLSGLRPHDVARAGVAHVPEGRRVFQNLTVDENLKVSFISARCKTSFARQRDEVFELFPRLAERRRQSAGTMSGGEQQMLAIGRALMNSPRLLMLDEPSLGLSPLVTELVFDRLAAIRDRGTSILLVEQNASALDIATRGIVLENGTVAVDTDIRALKETEFVRRAYLGT